MTLNLKEKTFLYLKENPEKRFTAREIGEWVFRTFPDECLLKKEKSKATKFPIITESDLIQQIVAEIGATRPDIQRKYPEIKTTEERPRKYYFSFNSNEDFEDTQKLADLTEKLTEHGLYTILSQFMKAEQGILTKRIDEKKASNKKGPNGNRWLFPDLVGFENLIKDFQQDTIDLIKSHYAKKAKLWSFEVKIAIDRSNLRESFFQTVSNSSWANYAYLVATELNSNARKELNMLCSLHGIGFILLDQLNPSESEILIPAAERADLDWNSINRLIEENSDFKDYIKLVKQFYLTEDPREKDWD